MREVFVEIAFGEGIAVELPAAVDGGRAFLRALHAVVDTHAIGEVVEQGVGVAAG